MTVMLFAASSTLFESVISANVKVGTSELDKIEVELVAGGKRSPVAFKTRIIGNTGAWAEAVLRSLKEKEKFVKAGMPFPDRLK